MEHFLDLMSFGPTGWGQLMLRAAVTTIAVAAAGYAIGMAIGALVCWARLSRSAVALWVSDVYVTVLRGVPDLLVIYLFYFGGSMLLTQFKQLLGGDGFVTLPTFMTGAAAIGVVSAAYQAEVMRGAFLAISKGEIEAGQAYGMTSLTLLRRIIAPQMLRFSIPGMNNVWQLVLKESALISVIGLVELMRQSALGSATTQQPFYFYGAAALFYLAITSVSGVIFRFLESHTSRGVRRA
ncbi:ABC transporter permease subunit [Paraburkholderia sp. J8-2]|uniref:ABC transporter permease n=1 Tax=Paraburkholderia sp. J8-2 TaxID=2805440 RepID=UPI002AB60E27|nr:ABC transporter permease subunit [Paraburkholderia sp. J8-2]